jgi:hypothetical protein
MKTDKTDVTPMRSDGQITTDTKQKSNILNKQCQSVYTVEPQDNIPDCTKTNTLKQHSQYLFQVLTYFHGKHFDCYIISGVIEL